MSKAARVFYGGCVLLSWYAWVQSRRATDVDILWWHILCWAAFIWPFGRVIYYLLAKYAPDDSREG